LKSRSTRRDADDIDVSPRLARHEVVHRALPDGSGQDYFVYFSRQGGQDSPPIVAVHDISRNAREQMQAFSEVCKNYGASLIAPHFAADRYPNYARLGRSRQSADRGRRADEALAAILEDIAQLSGMQTQRIYLFGFGAGGRFALRYAMAYPERVAAVTVALADAFTFPDPGKPFPRGIGPGTRRSDLEFRPAKFLRVPMTVLESASDRGPASSGKRVRAVHASGATPRDKARAWVEAMRAAAAEQRLECLVTYRELDEPLDSFAAFVGNRALAASVFKMLVLGLPSGRPMTGLPVALAPRGVVRAATEHDRWLAVREQHEQVAEPAPAVPSRAQRFALPGLLAAVLLAILTPLAIWANYRVSHVVSREAVVRSHIADVGARVDGVISSIEVDTGDRVQAGQIIARLEDRHFAARLKQARSQLQKARRELEVERLAIENERQRLSGSLREESAGLAAAQASVVASQSRADEARRQVELQRSLASKGLVPAERVRTAETELRTAQALAAEARAAVAAAGAGEDLARVASRGIAVREKRISVLESDIGTYEAELALAEANLAATVLRAPDDGAVVRRIVQPGASIAVGQPVISIWVGQQIWVEAWLDEDDLADVAVGSPATITFKSRPNREFAGVVETLGVSTDVELPDTEVPQPRQRRMRDTPVIGVRIRLNEPAQDLFPGLSAVVAIRKKAG
jgi:multidrug resistance efflux pump/poly(3-hydroxybutyrate) depolymerase